MRFTHTGNDLYKNIWVFLILTFVTNGCASVSLKEGGTLTSYDRLGSPKGKFAKKRIYLNTDDLQAIRTVSIFPASFTPAAEKHIAELQERLLVTNAIDRAMCITLSEKYRIVPFGKPADLMIRSVVTDIVPTQPSIAGASKAISLGSIFILPVGVPRLPFGLGGLAVEAEAVDRQGVQRAAIVWSRGANSFTSKARISQVGDAYDLAAAFGSEFSRMIIAGKEPENFNLRLPSAYELRTSLGGQSGSQTCDTYGRSPGLAGMLGATLGAPPSWSDKGAISSGTSFKVP